MIKYVDAQANGTTPELLARLSEELSTVRQLRLVDAGWLSHEDFARELECVLTAFRNRGGRILELK